MKRKFIDLSGICICLAAIGITLLYADQIREKDWVLTAAGIGLILFIFLAVRDGKMKQKRNCFRSTFHLTRRDLPHG